MKTGANKESQDCPVRFTLDHVGIAIGDLGKARMNWEKIFSSPSSEPEEIQREGVRLSFMDTENTRLELLESVSPDSAIARFLDRHKEGLHHLSFRIDGMELDSWFQELLKRGVQLIGEGPEEGADNTRIFFVHPAASGGVLIEFSQKNKESRA